MLLNVSIPAGDREMGAYLADGGSGPRPGIVLLQEIFGVNVAMKLAADTFAAAGYIVVVPDLFHRIQPGTALSYDPSDRPRAFELWEQLDEKRAIEDIVAAEAWLRGHAHCKGDIALLGFCLGGKLAVLAAEKGRPKAAVAFYPVRLQEHGDQIRRTPCPLQVHLGDLDTHVATEAREALQHDLSYRADNEFHLYPGAEHGFYNSVRTQGFHPQATALAHAATLRFLDRHLRLPSGD